jgi:hypothetical protein
MVLSSSLYGPMGPFEAGRSHSGVQCVLTAALSQQAAPDEFAALVADDESPIDPAVVTAPLPVSTNFEFTVGGS